MQKYIIYEVERTFYAVIVEKAYLLGYVQLQRLKYSVSALDSGWLATGDVSLHSLQVYNAKCKKAKK
jgi:hypothetical protein